jgi:alcohol dehydrogenase
MPTKIIFGLPLLEGLNKEVENFGSKAFIVIDKKFVSEINLLEKIIELLEKKKIKAVSFSEVESDPCFETVIKGVKLARKEKIDFVIGIGGGSVLDVAKLIAASYTNPRISLRAHTQKGKVQSCIWRGKKESLKVIAIPTTAGTGSEVSKACVIIDKKFKIKCSIKSPFFYPTIAIVDPKLTFSLPSDLTAFTGMDALSHLIEGYLSVGANPMTDILALEGIKLVMENLLLVIRDPLNIKARTNMMLAATYGGIVDSNAGLCVGHVLAHVIGAWYRIHHGLACAVFLPYVVEYNCGVRKDKIKILSKIFNHSNPVKMLKLFIKKLQIPSSLRELGIPQKDLSKIARKALENKSALKFNPKKVKFKDIKKILQKAFYGD